MSTPEPQVLLERVPVVTEIILEPDELLVLDAPGLQGVPGPTGPQGPVGPEGPEGPVGPTGADTLGAITTHIEDPSPHPAYDEGPSLVLLYENAKV